MAGCKYVKDFEFPASEGFTASAGKQMVKGYARGGACYAEGGSAPRSGADMIRRLESVTPGGRRLTDRQRKAMEKEGMTLVREEKEVIVPRPKPVNRAKGGEVGAAKIGKVMKEYKEGTLHSGSKKGPEVTNRRQAVAIALSEARKAGKKAHGGVMKKARGGVVKKADGGAVNPMMVGAPAPAPGMVGVTSAPSPLPRPLPVPMTHVDPIPQQMAVSRPMPMQQMQRMAVQPPARPESSEQARSLLSNLMQRLPPQALQRLTPEMQQRLQSRIASALPQGLPPQMQQRMQQRMQPALPRGVPAYSSVPRVSAPAAAMAAPAMKRGGGVKKK